ncbi:MAG: class I SAM-dependent methyltransferase [Lachnospiraceae bacterium]|nr:class I SAM-dependent methyltransferase [Lachnospiraceae bacterium]MBQ3515358.1 class I SAM-dependent methyltransferase [Lachnospiraceae bacterium]
MYKEIVIRKNIEQHMRELREWLNETADMELEEMGDFFTRRIGDYEEHMAVWSRAYQRFAQLLPADTKSILDLGCGTGLELDEIWKRNPEISVVGVDLCQSMLEKLKEKHSDKKLQVVCEDYFQYDFGIEQWEAVISFESFHHFLPKQKKVLYDKIYQSLKKGGLFILGDYIACCEEEERLLQEIYFQKRKKSGIPEERFVHFDIPFTLEHELTILQEAGFLNIRQIESMDGATMIVVEK